MKLHIHIRKLFDSQNRYLQWEKDMAKENARKARNDATPEQLQRSVGSRWHSPFGYIWWRPFRKRGVKNAQGKLLPHTHTDVQDE